MGVSEITYTCIFHTLTTMVDTQIVNPEIYRKLCQHLVLALPAAVFFNFLQVHPVLSLLQDGQWSIFLGVQHLGHGIDHPPQYTVEVRNEDTYISAPHCVPKFQCMQRHLPLPLHPLVIFCLNASKQVCILMRKGTKIPTCMKNTGFSTIKL